MIEIISSILEAEKKADDIINEALNKSKAMISDAEITADNVINSAIDVQKVHRISALKKSSDEAEEEYNKIISKGKIEADKIYESAKINIDSAADFIFKNIIK